MLFMSSLNWDHPPLINGVFISLLISSSPLPCLGPRKTLNDTTKDLIIYFSLNSLHGRLKYLLVLECFNTTKASHHHVSV